MTPQQKVRQPLSRVPQEGFHVRHRAGTTLRMRSFPASRPPAVQQSQRLHLCCVLLLRGERAAHVAPAPAAVHLSESGPQHAHPFATDAGGRAAEWTPAVRGGDAAGGEGVHHLLEPGGDAAAAFAATHSGERRELEKQRRVSNARREARRVRGEQGAHTHVALVGYRVAPVALVRRAAHQVSFCSAEIEGGKEREGDAAGAGGPAAHGKGLRGGEVAAQLRLEGRRGGTARRLQRKVLYPGALRERVPVMRYVIRGVDADAAERAGHHDGELGVVGAPLVNHGGREDVPVLPALHRLPPVGQRVHGDVRQQRHRRREKADVILVVGEDDEVRRRGLERELSERHRRSALGYSPSRRCRSD